MSLDIQDILDIASGSKTKVKNGTITDKSNSPVTNSNKQSKSKRKGNKFENEIAKILGEWIFNDQDALTRSITSGAKKIVYGGDIVPQKPINIKWNFFIECKNGYENNTPSFNNFTIVEKWLIKCLTEVDFDKQPIIWLICRFHNYSSIVITNCMLKNLIWKLCINIQHDNMANLFYIYNLKDMMKYRLSDLIDMSHFH